MKVEGARTMRTRNIPLSAFGLCGAIALAGCAGQTTTQAAAPGQEAKVIVCAPGSYTNGNECLPARTDCPAGTALQDGSCVKLAVAADPEPLPEKDPPPAAELTAPLSFDFVVDSRRGRFQPRARQLLVTEAQGLEALFRATPKDAADRPRLMRRLAETYTELSAAAARDGQATAMGSEVQKFQKIEQAARVAAMKYYATILQEYPKFCFSQNTGCNDEVLYYLALDHVRSGEKDKARKSLLQLIQSYPQSNLVAHAYFQFGEMFFTEATADPSKFALAEQSYKEATKYSASPIAPYALLRLAETYKAQGDGPKAQATLKKLVAQFPTSGAAQQVAPGP